MNVWFALVTIAMVAAYVWFTFAITRWRIQFRRDMNESDQDANTKAVDSLLNYETVKYFNNEGHETRRFDRSMEKFARASIQAQTSLSVLNTGQAVIMALGMGAVMVLAAIGIKAGRFTVGDLVMANAYLMQLYQPLNLLGTVYREITQALVDMDAMFRLLHQPQEVKDKPGAQAAEGSRRRNPLRQCRIRLRPGAHRAQRASASPCRPARQSRWWVRRAPESPRSRAFFIASTTSRAAA